MGGCVGCCVVVFVERFCVDRLLIPHEVDILLISWLIDYIIGFYVVIKLFITL